MHSFTQTLLKHRVTRSPHNVGMKNRINTRDVSDPFSNHEIETLR